MGRNSTNDGARTRRRLRRRGALGGGFALVAILLVTMSPATSQEQSEPTAPGKLRLVANDTDGDGFRYSDGESELTELFATNQQGRITGDQGDTDLTTLAATGRGGDPYPAVKSHEVGVRAQGEGNGTPASQLNIGPYKDILDSEGELLYSEEPNAQTLTIVFDGEDIPGTVAWEGEVSLAMKFGATALVEGFLGEDPEPVVAATIDCAGGPDSDCGPDSGLDRASTGVFGNGVDTLFDRVVISIQNPSDGAASLISEDGFPTWFGISDLDGVLACGDTATQSALDGAYSSSFTRIDSDALDDDCLTLKPYEQEIILAPADGGPTQINFEPESSVQSTYRGVLTFPAGADVTFFERILEIDRDGPDDSAGFGQSQPCIRTEVVPGNAAQLALAAAFPEMGPGFYPELPQFALDSDGNQTTNPEIACVVAYTATAGRDITFVERLDYDPFHR